MARSTTIGYLLTSFLLFVGNQTISQSADFLQGVWKIENKEQYEHWDKLNDRTLQGFSYEKKGDQLLVREYLKISREQKETTYTATVVGQNQGKGVPFRLTSEENGLTFQNRSHDFPKTIFYRSLAPDTLLVSVSGGEGKGFQYKMTRQHRTDKVDDATFANPSYDRILAAKLGGDDYGMKSYVWVILKSGPNKTTDKAFISECFRGHLANINRLVEEGKLIVAGPLGANDHSYRGIFIFNVTGHDQVKTLLQTDPAIREGLLETEIYTWYGSAALPVYLEYADKIWKSKP